MVRRKESEDLENTQKVQHTIVRFWFLAKNPGCQQPSRLTAEIIWRGFSPVGWRVFVGGRVLRWLARRQEVSGEMALRRDSAFRCTAHADCGPALLIGERVVGAAYMLNLINPAHIDWFGAPGLDLLVIETIYFSLQIAGEFSHVTYNRINATPQNLA